MIDNKKIVFFKLAEINTNFLLQNFHLCWTETTWKTCCFSLRQKILLDFLQDLIFFTQLSTTMFWFYHLTHKLWKICPDNLPRADWITLTGWLTFLRDCKKSFYRYIVIKYYEFKCVEPLCSMLFNWYENSKAKWLSFSIIQSSIITGFGLIIW